MMLRRLCWLAGLRSAAYGCRVPTCYFPSIRRPDPDGYAVAARQVRAQARVRCQLSQALAHATIRGSAEVPLFKKNFDAAKHHFNPIFLQVTRDLVRTKSANKLCIAPHCCH
eukprot:6180006-Pleurochrysis_carterae.AAC.1